MISQKCPKCLSSRIRRGYRPTPWWSKVLFRYNLLCDNCNWEFTGFAVPGTVSSKPTKNPKKKPTGKLNESVDNNKSTKNSLGSLQNEPSEPIVSLDNLAGQNIGAGKKGQR
jgi:hypothetical protein